MARDRSPTARRDYPSRWPGYLALPRRPAHPVLAVALGAGLLVYAWFDGAAVPFSRGAFLGVVIPGAVLGLIAAGRPPERIPPPEELDLTGLSYWVICLALFFEWEASAWRDSSWPWHPSFTNLLAPLLVPHLVKSVAILVWLLAGWALVRR
jgi:hypothetical protein